MRILALAMNTFREEVRRKVFLFLLLFVAVMIGTSLVFSFFTPSEELKIVKDMGFTAIWLAGTVISIVMGVRMLPGEIDKRTIYTLLCKPISRTEYLIGKFLGGALTLAANTAVMALIFLLVVLVKGKMAGNLSIADLLLVEQVLLFYVQFCLLLAMALMLSTCVTPIMNGSITLFVLIIGNMSDTLMDIINRANNVLAVTGLRILYYLVPNWQTFSIQDALVRGDPVALSYITKVIAYGAVYTLVVMIIAAQAFRSREV